MENQRYSRFCTQIKCANAVGVRSVIKARVHGKENFDLQMAKGANERVFWTFGCAMSIDSRGLC